MGRKWFELIQRENSWPWFVDDPIDSTISDEWIFWDFTSGKRLDVTRYKDVRSHFNQTYPRERVDCFFCTHGTPVFSRHVYPLIRNVCGSDIQRIPLVLYDDTCDVNDYEIYAVGNVISCFDYSTTSHELETGSTNKLRMVSPDWSIIGREIPPGVNWFYVEEWPSALIVSDEVAAALSNAKVSGLSYLRR